MPDVGVKNILFPRGNQNYELKLFFLFLMGWAFAHLWGLIRLVHSCGTWILLEVQGICKLFQGRRRRWWWWWWWSTPILNPRTMASNLCTRLWMMTSSVHRRQGCDLNSTLSTTQVGGMPLHTNCIILFHSVALCFAISLALLCKMDMNAKQGTSLTELGIEIFNIFVHGHSLQIP